MSSLSVILITYNNEKTLHPCLKSVAHIANEIIVVDSESSDKTVEIAKSFGAKVIIQKWLGYSKQKNLALTHVTSKWVLWLDADEVFQIRPNTDLMKQLDHLSHFAGFKVKRRTFFLNRWLDHCLGHEYIIRLFKNQAEHTFVQTPVHESVQIKGSSQILKSVHIDHYSYENLKSYLNKSILYGDLYVEKALQKNKTMKTFRLFFVFPIRFLKLYILKRGFLDGTSGLIFSMMSAAHDFYKYSRLWEETHKVD
ncbi:hypothetical protein AB834_01735 [PVC group bacterium (ex Bugula neritina AB1)]|nr:hypothetical protein AB834_01735 [PVC group bacterium (ex Bugula neritina AB1)]